MERIRLGTKIAISWAIYDLNGRAHGLEGKDIQLYMTCGGLKQAVTSYTVLGNVLSWVFLGSEQKKLGVYKLVLIETNPVSGNKCVDVCEAFRIVSENVTAVEDDEDTVNVSVRSVLTDASIIGVESVDVIESTEDGGINYVSIHLVDGSYVDLPIRNGSKGDKGDTGAKGDKGDQGNTGSSVDYPYELVNNLTTDDAEKGLSAAQGVVLEGEISQLAQKIDAFGPFSGTTASRPTNVSVGHLYFDTNLLKYITWNGTSWVNMDGTALS